MASITFSGQLDQAMNELAAEGNKVLFIPHQSVGEVLPGAASELVVESDGTYSITLAYNTYSIYHYSDVTKRKTLLATDVVVSADTLVSTIPDLIGSTVPVTEDSVLAIQSYLVDASNYASSAESSATSAASSASIAQSAATAATTSGAIYSSIADGLAATLDGEYFSVLSQEDDDYIDLYLNDGGVASYQKSYPSSERVESIESTFESGSSKMVNGETAIYAIVDSNQNTIEYYEQDETKTKSIGTSEFNTDGEDICYAITDSTGSIALSVTGTGGLISAGEQKESEVNIDYDYAIADSTGSVAIGIDDTGSIVTGSENKSNETNVDYAYAITDSTGAVALGVDHDGNLIFSGSSSESEWSERYQAENMFVESYGQSLSRGSNGQPALSTTQLYNNRMFESGVRWAGDQVLTSFVALIEQDDEGVNGETCVTTATNILTESDPDYDDNGTSYIGSSTGLGGQTIAQLSKGEAVYNRLLVRLQAAYDLSVTENRSFNFYQMFWTQGEADYSIETSKDDYIDALVKLQYDISYDSKLITGQTFEIPFIMYQCAAHYRQGYDYPTIALAQSEACANNDNLHMACAMYQFKYADDLLHLTNDGYVMLGWYYGLAAQELKETGSVSHCYIKRAINQGNIIEVQINTPNPPLVIDTTVVAETNNYGFDILDSNGDARDIIDTVTISGVDRVKIVINDTINDGDTLAYAHGVSDVDLAGSGRDTGPRGNIRDSRGDLYNWTNSTGGTDRADNWLIISDVEILK